MVYFITMSNFWKGFEKTAKIYDSMLSAIGSQRVSQKLMSGSQFAAKQEALLAARKAEKLKAAATAAKAAVPPKVNFAQKVQQAAANKVNTAGQLSPMAQQNLKNLNPAPKYRAELVGDRGTRS